MEAGMDWSFEDKEFSDLRRVADLDGRCVKFAGVTAIFGTHLTRNRSTPTGSGVYFVDDYRGSYLDLPNMPPSTTVRDAVLMIGSYLVGRETEQHQCQRIAKTFVQQLSQH